jgi:2-polyprenyl-6-hydroxyphenyl methylase/3-demethylubiquinone-9 3-methyltransferase
VSNELEIWGEAVPREVFSAGELRYLEPLVGRPLPELASVWSEMDRVWDSYGLNNALPLTGQNVARFYSHPVWTMNAFFTAAHPDSIKHRESIARYVSAYGSGRIADYGGGGGELARRISALCPDAEIEIIEPFPSALGKHRVSRLKNVSFSNKLDGKYDLIIAQDVLEHVDDPIAVAQEIYAALEENGVAVFANCFFPFIKCHLPHTFHLRQTFGLIMGLGGLELQGVVQGAEHAQIFRKQLDKNRFPLSVFLAERLSRNAGWILHTAAWLRRQLRNKKNHIQRILRSRSH